MMVAGPIALGAMHDLTGYHLDGLIGEDVVDAHPRTLVEVDEVGRNGIAPAVGWDGVAQAEFGKLGEHPLPALHEAVDGFLRLQRNAAEGGNQLGTVDRILRTDGVEIAAHDEWALKPGDHAGKIPRLVFGATSWVGMIGSHRQDAEWRLDHGAEPAPIVNVELDGARNGVPAQDHVAPGAVVKGRCLVRKCEERAVVDGLAGVGAAKQRFVQHEDVGLEGAHERDRRLPPLPVEQAALRRALAERPQSLEDIKGDEREWTQHGAILNEAGRAGNFRPGALSTEERRWR